MKTGGSSATCNICLTLPAQLFNMQHGYRLLGVINFAAQCMLTVAIPVKLKHLLHIFTSSASSPHKLAMGITLGVLFGLFPFIILPTIFVVIAALRLKLSMSIMMVFNYAVLPLQIILFVPYTRTGHYLFGGNATVISFAAMRHAFSTGFFTALRSLFGVALLATGGWFVTGIPAGLLLYAIVYFIAKHLYKRQIKKSS